GAVQGQGGEGGGCAWRKFELGVRGVSRSQVLSGLAAGDEVLLADAAQPGEDASDESGKDEGDGSGADAGSDGRSDASDADGDAAAGNDDDDATEATP